MEIKNLLYRMADDALIIGHRNSEWTGLGPILEEDIAFSSIAQDKIGHSLALYTMLQEMGEGTPEEIAFTRNAPEYTCCHLVEYPIGGYDFSLMRHFFFDTAELLRYQMLRESTFEPLAKLSKKIAGEVKYHVFHANTWVVQLGAQGTEESHMIMQNAVNQVYPLALGIFEPSKYEAELSEKGIFVGENVLEKAWHDAISVTLEKAGLTLPTITDKTIAYGGRYGSHTDHLQTLVDEMTEVYRLEPKAEW